MKTTTDLWLATFILLQGEQLADYKKLGHRKVEFGFNTDGDQWKAYKLQYLASPFAKFEQEMSKLRELSYE